VRAALQAADIPTAVHYPVPVNRQPGYQGLCGGCQTPIAAWLAEHVVSLPMGPDLAVQDQDAVVEAVHAAAGGENSKACPAVLPRAA